MSDRPTPETDAFSVSFKSIDDPLGQKQWVPSDLVRRLERERDEAREELHDIRINLGDDAEGYTLLHAVCVMQNERDEVMEKLSAAWQSLRDSQDEVLRLTFENRELRNLSNE